MWVREDGIIWPRRAFHRNLFESKLLWPNMGRHFVRAFIREKNTQHPQQTLIRQTGCECTTGMPVKQMEATTYQTSP